VASKLQHRFSISVLGSEFIGRLALPNRLTDAAYHRFYLGAIPVLLEHAPLHQRQHMRFMHDGAPPHFVSFVGQHLNQTLYEQWIGQGGLVNWPARSPDLNPLDFWLWGHLNTSVYSAPSNDLEVLQQRVENAWQGKRVKPGIFNECAYLCVTKSWKLCWNAGEPHRAPDVEIIAHISAGTGLRTWTLRWVLYLLKACSTFKHSVFEATS
jgi:hypothetical protein